jgi:hypothetical protein
LLERGLSKATIDGAISSLSAVLGYALREHRIEVNPALGARIDLADTRLQPKRSRTERRWIPPPKRPAACSTRLRRGTGRSS